ncbi:hypothetical protein HDU87_002033 [Geranomyces variabilis]|uniref:SH3 domain-containing protein n=1 Tax=Geranomyces variabilis TaxID=109894 RepID=A0AAD5TLY7_9FUNG|nr:hypothetical protein HDU87_002033 [Geranomyces variabilis]
MLYGIAYYQPLTLRYSFQNCGRNTHGIEPDATATPTPPPASSPASSPASAPASTPATAAAPTTPATAIPSASLTLVPGSNSLGATSTSTPSILTPGAPGVSVADPSVSGNRSDPSSAIGQAPGSSSSSSSSRTALIVGPILAAVVLLAVGAVLATRRHQQNMKSSAAASSLRAEAGIGAAAGAIAAARNSDSSRPLFTNGAGMLNVSSVLEKRYVCAHAYSPAADDEITLNVGDQVRLNLLFNDGWAKGYNETTGMQGLLPCACIKEEDATPPGEKTK